MTHYVQGKPATAAEHSAHVSARRAFNFANESTADRASTIDEIEAEAARINAEIARGKAIRAKPTARRGAPAAATISPTKPMPANTQTPPPSILSQFEAITDQTEKIAFFKANKNELKLAELARNSATATAASKANIAAIKNLR